MFFSDDKVVFFFEVLGWVFEKWSYLFELGFIDYRLLSVESFEVVYNMNLLKKLCDINFNFILCLVLDFVVKGFEVFYFVW